MFKLILAAAVVAAASGQPGTPSRAVAPVVVELFTSQGCSSCPPADDLLRRLAADPTLRGKVIPIAYHVDYWDSLGWRDPFSSNAWTQRQMQYVHAFGLGSAYTPQAVVAGGRELVGSNERALRAAIAAAAAATPDAAAQVSIVSDTAVIVTNVHRPGLELVLLTTEDGAVTRVERGENGGMTLTSGSIVRRLERLGGVPTGASARRSPVVIDRGWNRAKSSVVVLLQDPKTLRIHAAAMAMLR